MTNARTLPIVFVLVCGGCAGEVSDGASADGVLAEFPSIAPTTPPPGVRQPEWDAESVDDETRSTHLWLVNRAIDLLATSALPQARDVVALLRDRECQRSWHQGLADADFKAAYNGGWFDVPVGAPPVALVLAGATFASHFYDPDSGRNYKGQTSPTAYDQGLAHFANARAALGDGDRDTGCYELGLSLHYFTDITQPMHSSNYTAISHPIELHSDYESYAMSQQARFVTGTWSGPTNGDPAAQLLAAAKASKPMWPVVRTAIANAFAARGCGRFSWYLADHTGCWEGDAAVDDDLGAELRASENATADYLYATALR